MKRTNLETFEEKITISREAKIPAEFYHLKAAGLSNLNKLAAFVRRSLSQY